MHVTLPPFMAQKYGIKAYFKESMLFKGNGNSNIYQFMNDNKNLEFIRFLWPF